MATQTKEFIGKRSRTLRIANLNIDDQNVDDQSLNFETENEKHLQKPG